MLTWRSFKMRGSPGSFFAKSIRDMGSERNRRHGQLEDTATLDNAWRIAE
jgi:hypothetical protein